MHKQANFGVDTIKKEQRCYYLEQNAEEYIYPGIFNFSNLLKKYFTKIYDLLKSY